MDGDGAIAFARRDTDWHTVADESEAFYLRIAGAGPVPVPGRRPRDPGHARPVHGRRPRADRPGPPVDHRHQGRSSRASRPAQEHRRPTPEPFGFKMLLSWPSAWIYRAMLPFTFRSIEELELGPDVAGRLRGAVAALPGLVPAGGRGRAAVVRDERADAPRAHARAGAGVRAGGRARRRRRPRRADALAVQAAAVPRRMLPGRVDARRRPVLVRNYDYAPSRIEGIDLATRLLEKRVIGMSDCLWGCSTA